MKRTIGILLCIMGLVCLIAVAMGVTDYLRVCRFLEKPIFAKLDIETALDNGGSGLYRGLGYSFEIEGDFMPEDEFPGVTYYSYRLFGYTMDTGVRD